MGGLIAWSVHFTGLYVVASLDALTPAGDTGLWLTAAIALSLLCVAGCIAIAHLATRRLRRADEAAVVLLNQLALLGAILAIVAIAWQTLSVVMA